MKSSKKRWFIILAVFLYIVSEGLQQELAYQSWKLLIIKIVTSIGICNCVIDDWFFAWTAETGRMRLKHIGNILIAAFVAVSVAKVFMMLWQYKRGAV